MDGASWITFAGFRFQAAGLSGLSRVGVVGAVDILNPRHYTNSGRGP